LAQAILAQGSIEALPPFAPPSILQQ